MNKIALRSSIRITLVSNLVLVISLVVMAVYGNYQSGTCWGTPPAPIGLELFAQGFAFFVLFTMIASFTSIPIIGVTVYVFMLIYLVSFPQRD